MAGKKKLDKDKDKDKSWVGEMESYSRQIWLAGLGAYAKMGKEGARLFETLIKDGEEAEKAARGEIDKQVEVLKERVGKSSKAGKDPVDTARAKVDKSRGKLLERWGELESVFDKRLNSAVSRLGVPSRDEVKALEDKVDALSRNVLELLEGKSAPAKVAPKAKPATVAGSVTPAASEQVTAKAINGPVDSRPKTAPRRRAPSGTASKAAKKPVPSKPSKVATSVSKADAKVAGSEKAAKSDKGADKGTA